MRKASNSCPITARFGDFVSHDGNSSVCKKYARKIVNCHKLFVELEKAFAVGCAVEEAKESPPRTPTRETFLLVSTAFANSSNHSQARSQYRMRVNNLFMVNFIFGPSKANSWRRRSTSCNRNEPKQCINTWQITEVSNSTKRHADTCNSGNHAYLLLRKICYSARLRLNCT